MVSRSSLPHSIRGFTLVELMVVIAIMAILAVLAGPPFREFIAKQRTKSAAYELAQTLQTARSNAILNRRSVDVRASYPATTSTNVWNGAKTGTPFQDNVTDSSTTNDQAKIEKSSFYIFETGTDLVSGLQSNTTSANNRVTKITKLNDNVVVNATGSILWIRFTPSSGVQASTTATMTTAPVAIGSTNVTFNVSYPGYSSAGGAGSYQVTLNHFGGTQVKKN